ncbi:multidrug resistance-associated ABC transporter [Panaeolus papilionaceus]|nr:multidrug resistance-associated ABC transporter [Panaeolus papilionaceus]
MQLCAEDGPWDFQSPCVRAAWASIVPAAFIFTLCITKAGPVPWILNKLLGGLGNYLKPYLSLQEAESLSGDSSEDGQQDNEAGNTVAPFDAHPIWKSTILILVGGLMCLAWAAMGAIPLLERPLDLLKASLYLLTAFSWMYSVFRPLTRPSHTPQYDVLVLYMILFTASILQIGGVIYGRTILGSPLPSIPSSILLAANFVALVIVISLVFSMPLNLPSAALRAQIGQSMSPEDYTTLWGWISFSWLYPLILRGRKTTLNESDVWKLSPIMQSRALFTKFNSIHRSTLLRRLWAANSLDLILVFILTVTSVALHYTSPFFLKRILDALDSPRLSPEIRAKAYLYAFLAFICRLLRSQCDTQQLWLGRRASTRVRSELMASIYDKSLKRKDFSGTVDKADKNSAKPESNPKASKGKQKAQKTGSPKEASSKADDPKAGADIGKIVNMMSSDSIRVSMKVATVFNIFGAPFDIIFGCIFLYKLMGISAFAGFIVLLPGWPLNRYLSQRSVRILKGVLSARDKRMGALNELIRSIKFIKFFGWEEKWIKRVLDARQGEMSWFVKARINTVVLQLLWSTAPILVSITSFGVYVMLGNQLTISVAFTAVALFGMIRGPLNDIPSWAVDLMRARVALRRIEVFLEEDEVSEQVSSLKSGLSELQGHSSSNEGLGLDHATLKWNQVVDKTASKEPKEKASKAPILPVSDSEDDGRTTVADIQSDREQVGERAFELKGISVLFPEGQLSLVTGPTASGKTALLLAMLGEMTLLSGRIIMKKNTRLVDEHGLMHSISYAAQTPWLRHQSIKDNILFGYPFDEARYNEVLECCALNPDLAILEDGDLTEIGSRGVNLSGGQKARVALARAVYARTKYVLLDDPLSAVDSHTARHLYERLLCGPLLAHRAVVLVTHHVGLVLPGANYLVRMLDGRIDEQGTIKDLDSLGKLEDIVREESVKLVNDDTVLVDLPKAETRQETTIEAVTEVVTKRKEARKLVQEEHRAKGNVRWNVYLTYLRASSYWTWVMFISIIVFVQILNFAEKFWIKTWGEAYETDEPAKQLFYLQTTGLNHIPSMSGDSDSIYGMPLSQGKTIFGHKLPSALESPLFYVGVYALIGAVNVLVKALSAGIQFTGAIRASKILFQQLLVSVVRAPFRFHDTTPLGRIMNRFGKDMEAIDTNLSRALQLFQNSMAGFFASIIIISVIFPWFLIPMVIIVLAYRQLALGYLHAGRDLRRMEAVSRSPVFAEFAELLDGIVTVRAFSAEHRFLNNLHVRLDATTKMWYLFWMANRWLALNCDVLGAVIVLLTMLFSIATLSNDAGLAGLCITVALSFTQIVYWACRQWTAVELDLNAAERIVEYLDLAQEPPAIIESNRVPAYWPSGNANDSLVVVEDLEVKYAPELPSVLHGVSFSLKAGERVGLLGRTGSGKSTLAMSLLRFVDPSKGRIIIDGVDISTIGTYDLRSRLTFIPQDATLFSGTLRENLNPFGEHTDAECLDALRRVQMITDNSGYHRSSDDQTDVELSSVAGASSFATVTAAGSESITLETKVAVGGSNFSHGQRQLIAMARALLRRSSIVVLDEATSSIDFATDTKIQNTIREEFTGSLLITIAHRLRTIIDYDRLIVLDQGKVAEFDTPWNLINKEGGIFRNMCQQSGSFTELEATAKLKAHL